MQTIAQPHCQQCGSTDYEDVSDPSLEGYTACCNERVVWPNGNVPCDPRECSHK